MYSFLLLHPGHIHRFSQFRGRIPQQSFTSATSLPLTVTLTGEPLLTQQQQLDLPGGPLSVPPELLVDLLGPLGRLLLQGADGATHLEGGGGAAPDTRLTLCPGDWGSGSLTHSHTLTPAPGLWPH